ncbi:MAG: DNA polymerase III subunit gamma/tau [Bdellovibrionota bacterium]|nr:MAG: DNA polymerase III subunit gamma/tau [Bdellovibrionota bacterium]
MPVQSSASHLVIARKYRPGTFATVTGQEHVTRTLMNSIRRNRIAHAYLFAGPRGVGKTSVARIFAKALNCKDLSSFEPCLECSNCLEIAQGNSLAVREIDGASHNSVDNVRELIDSFRSPPPPGSRYKVYIIDEVHMLSLAAFNALLKSLEEPPPFTVFVLATTESHKIPETVISRCQRHDFRALSNEQLEARLEEIVKAEKLKVEPGVLRLISRFAEGSMRDAQSLLERVQSFCDDAITVADATKVLGTVGGEALLRLSRAILERNAAQALDEVHEAFSSGIDSALFLREFITYWRELLVAKAGGEKALRKVRGEGSDTVEILRQVELVSLADLQDLVHLARQGTDEAIRSAFPKASLEALVVRLATREPALEMRSLVEEIRRGGSSASPGTPRPEGTPRLVSHDGTKPRSSPAVPSEPPPALLDWGEFVRAMASRSRMLAENLKRAVVVTFSVNRLILAGSEFLVGVLKQPENLQRLREGLKEFSKSEEWDISFRIEEQLPSESLHSVEVKAKTTQAAKTRESVANHPAVRKLQEAFPGSNIEEIKLREND